LGLTFTGTSDKIFFSECPFRGVDAAGVTVLDFAAGCSTGIVDITDCYVKSVQSDTVVVAVDPSATISEIFQYRGTTHDASVTKSNILTGAVGVAEVGTKTLGCFPLKDSTVGGELGFNSGGVVTGSGAGAVRVGSANVTTTPINLERLSESAEGQLQYDATFDESVNVAAYVGTSGSNTSFELSIAKNGSKVNGSSVGFLSTGSDATTIATGAKVNLTTGDTVSVLLENVGGTTDLSVESYSLVV